MTEGQFAVIACALLTIAIMVGPAWHAVFTFFAALAAWIVTELLIQEISRRRERRSIPKVLR